MPLRVVRLDQVRSVSHPFAPAQLCTQSRREGLNTAVVQNITQDLFDRLQRGYVAATCSDILNFLSKDAGQTQKPCEVLAKDLALTALAQFPDFNVLLGQALLENTEGLADLATGLRQGFVLPIGLLRDVNDVVHGLVQFALLITQAASHRLGFFDDPVGHHRELAVADGPAPTKEHESCG